MRYSNSCGNSHNLSHHTLAYFSLFGHDGLFRLPSFVFFVVYFILYFPMVAAATAAEAKWGSLFSVQQNGIIVDVAKSRRGTKGWEKEKRREWKERKIEWSWWWWWRSKSWGSVDDGSESSKPKWVAAIGDAKCFYVCGCATMCVDSVWMEMCAYNAEMSHKKEKRRTQRKRKTFYGNADRIYGHVCARRVCM